MQENLQDNNKRSILDIHSKESIVYIKNFALKQISEAIEESINKRKEYLNTTLKEYSDYGLLSNLEALLLDMSCDTRRCMKVLRDTRMRLQLIDKYELAEKEEFLKFKSKLTLVSSSDEK